MKFVSVPDNFSRTSASLDLEGFFTDERLQMFGDMIPDGLIAVDRTGIVRYMNTAAESINEVVRASIVGRSLSELVQQTRLDCSALMDAFARGSRVNLVVSDGSDRSYAMSTRCTRQWDGSTTCFLIVLRNLDALARISTHGPGAAGIAGLAGAQDSMPVESEPIISGPEMTQLVDRGLRAMAMGSRLLVLGESGVGKTELARYLHRHAGSMERPFVHVNCGSIPDSLFESEMFGYERGSFTGASTRGKKGLIEAADGGTLFLDEVGEIPLHCQAKMLQVLEEGIVQRVGATAPRRLRIQVIAATNRDLRKLVEEGCFRRDLYYRLSVVTVMVPPLRQRREMIPLLLDRFLTEINRRRTMPLKIEGGCRARLLSYNYPGNVRELQNIVEHLAVVCDKSATEADLPVEQMDLPSDLSAYKPCACHSHGHGGEDSAGLDFTAGFDLRDVVRNYESRLIDAAIQKTGSKRKAAELLSVDIATIVRKSKGASGE
ncbi:MAG TPA: sigma 54-interacting transcriptional regulator [Noviherbaspirillum sp.]